MTKTCILVRWFSHVDCPSCSSLKRKDAKPRPGTGPKHRFFLARGFFKLSLLRPSLGSMCHSRISTRLLCIVPMQARKRGKYAGGFFFLFPHSLRLFLFSILLLVLFLLPC
ncbi:hypothetical protein ABW19_dt0200515 [Dactylella cylindrospora]|nr:hypothetical protein ABW19_dt0200515 [Dactylella cylindrospora]